jgi:hypothetical protein
MHYWQCITSCSDFSCLLVVNEHKKKEMSFEAHLGCKYLYLGSIQISQFSDIFMRIFFAPIIQTNLGKTMIPSHDIFCIAAFSKY